MEHFFKSSTVTKVIVGLCVLLVAALVFEAGVFVGYHRESYSYNRDLAYERGFANPNSIFQPFMDDDDMGAPHGAIGQIVAVHMPTIMIKNHNATEQIISIGTSTTIRLLNGDASTSDLKVGNGVIVIGEPGDEGQVQASFVRILPPPPTDGSQGRMRGPMMNGSSSIPTNNQ